MVAKHGETEYYCRVTNLFDKLLDNTFFDANTTTEPVGTEHQGTIKDQGNRTSCEQ